MERTLWCNSAYLMDSEEIKDLALNFECETDDEYEIVDYVFNEFELDYLRTEMNTVNGFIVALADVGRWDGRVDGYKVYPYGSKIGDVLYSDCDYCRWYIDEEGALRLDAIHHDGTNHVSYYVVPNYTIDDLELSYDDVDGILYCGETCDDRKINPMDILIPLTEDMLF